MINGAAVNAETIDGVPPYQSACIVTGAMIAASDSCAGASTTGSAVTGAMRDPPDAVGGTVAIVLPVDGCNVWHTFGRNRTWHSGC